MAGAGAALQKGGESSDDLMGKSKSNKTNVDDIDGVEKVFVDEESKHTEGVAINMNFDEGSDNMDDNILAMATPEQSDTSSSGLPGLRI